MPVFTASSTTACPQTSATYSVSGSDSAYVWTITGDADINGLTAPVTTTTQSVTVNFSNNWNGGNLCVYGVNSCGSSDTRCMHINSSTNCRTAKSTLDQASINSSEMVHIYPNPTTGKIVVDYHINTTTGLLQLFDVLSKPIVEFRLDGSKSHMEFDIADLCCGIFEYRAIDTSNNIAGRGKLVIVR